MRRSLTIFFVAALLVSSEAFAQQDEWKILLDTREVNDLVIDGEYVWASTPSGGVVRTNITTKQRTFFQEHNSGIIDNAVYAIARGSNTDLWVVTLKGLSIFDGSAWRTMTTSNSGLPSDLCTDVLFDKEQVLWITTADAGIASYDGTSWKYFSTANGLTTNQYSKLAMDSSGAVYAMSTSRIVRIQNNVASLLPPDDLKPAENQFTLAEQYESIACDKQGNLYTGTSRLALHKFNGTTWQSFPLKQGTNSSTLYLYAPVRGLTVAPDNDVWVDNGHALIRFENDSAVEVHIEVSALTLAMGGKSLWLGGDGVQRFDLTAQFDPYPTADAELPGNTMREIVADEYGRVWLISSDGQLTRYDGEAWKRYTMLPRGVRSLCAQSPDTTWFVYGINGAGKLAGETYTDFFAIRDTDLFHATFRLAKDRHNDIWFGKRTGMLKESDMSLHTFQNTSTFYNAQKIGFDLHNTMWIGIAYFGIASYDGTTWKSSYDLDFEFPAESVWDLGFDSQGLMWCASNEGLISFDGTTTTTFPREGLSDDLGAKASLAIENDSSFWVGTFDGLYHFDKKTWTRFDTTNSPLPDNSISDVALDTKGNLWIGLSYGGVAIYRPGGLLLSVDHPTPRQEDCSFVIMPNPAIDEIHLDSDFRTYIIADISGRAVSSGISTSAIAVKDLPSGIYFLTIEKADGTNCRSRFIISR